MEDEFPDVTDERDTFSPPDEPTEMEWKLQELWADINFLERNIPYGYKKEIVDAHNRLEEIIERLEKPF